MADQILSEVQRRVAIITLNRPHTLNAMTPNLMAELKVAVTQADENPDVRVVVVTGAGRAFSSGGDRDFLEALGTMGGSEIKETVYANFQGAIKAVKLLSKPTIAAVNGPAVGAGCELAVACDFRVASSSAQFVESWIHLGTIAPLGGMFLLPRIVGLARATEMLMLGKPIEAIEAERIGLVNQVVEPEQLTIAATSLAERLAAGPPLALGIYKEGLRRSLESSLSAEWEAGLYAQSLLIQSDDFKEAVAAAAEKRPPNFTGR